MLAAGNPMPVFRLVLEPEEVQVGFKLRIFSNLRAQTIDRYVQTPYSLAIFLDR